MDIIFQSGEFYNEPSFWSQLFQILASLLGAIISAGIAIWVFKQGLKKEEQKEVQRLKDVKNYFENSLENLVLPINQYVEQITRISRQLKSRDYDFPDFEFHVGLHTNRIQEIASSDLFKIYLTDTTNEKSESYRKLLIAIDLLPALVKNIKDCFEELKKGYQLYEPRFQNHAEEILRLYLEFASQAAQEDETMNRWHQIMEEWKALENDPNIKDRRIPYILEEHLLDPMLGVCMQVNDQRALRLSEKIRDAKFALEQITELRTYIRKTVLSTGRKFLKGKYDIETALNVLN